MYTYVGYYNWQGYSIDRIDEKNNRKRVYDAGNSLEDSTSRVSAEKGVGLQAMRSCCIRTTREFAKENNGKYGGVEKIDFDEDWD